MSHLSSRTAPRPAPGRPPSRNGPQLRVGGSLIRLRVPGRDPIPVEPTIRHRSRIDFSGFGRLESYEYGRLRHRVEAIIPRDTLEQWARAQEAPNPPSWDDLLTLAYPGTQPHLDGDDPAFVVARLEIEEHPRIIQQRLESSWGAWLRAIDGTSGLVGDVVDHLEARGGPGAAAGGSDGSLFHIRSVAVHPAFHGQAIRRRLIAHTLWALHRAMGDVAVILVLPTLDPLGPGTSPPAQDAASIHQLARYYQRMGFRRSLGGRIVAGQPIPMHVFFGVEPLRVSGLHEIGIMA